MNLTDLWLYIYDSDKITYTAHDSATEFFPPQT